MTRKNATIRTRGIWGTPHYEVHVLYRGDVLHTVPQGDTRRAMRTSARKWAKTQGFTHANRFKLSTPCYINMRGPLGLETIDEFDSIDEGQDMLREYSMSHAGVYLSRKPCAGWHAK